MSDRGPSQGVRIVSALEGRNEPSTAIDASQRGDLRRRPGEVVVAQARAANGVGDEGVESGRDEYEFRLESATSGTTFVLNSRRNSDPPQPRARGTFTILPMPRSSSRPVAGNWNDWWVEAKNRSGSPSNMA